jgi:hypothetical protein
MTKFWALLILVFLSVPAFAATATTADSASTTCPAKTQKNATSTTANDNDGDVACVANAKISPAVIQTRTAKTPTPRWHSMLPGMFR